MNKEGSIRILHIANGDDCLGSAQCLYEILQYELKCMDIEPVVLTPEYTGMNKFCEVNGIENHVVKYCEFMYPKHDKMAEFKYILRKMEYSLNKSHSLNKVLSQIDLNKIDIIHTNNSMNDIGLRLAVKMNKTHVWHLREGGLYQQNLYPYFKDFAKYMSSSNTSFIAVSNAVKTEWINLGIPENLIEVIYDGVKVSNEVYPKYHENKVRFVMTGAYSEIKGQIQVINAVAMLPKNYRKKIHVDFWGNGVQSYVNFLRNEIEKNHLQDIVELKGFSNNVWETLSGYDVGLNCTRFEAFGRTTVEFLIKGIPVIASDLGANKELIDDSNGIFYEYGNVEKLMQSIIFMVDNWERYNNSEISNYAKTHYTCEVSNKKINDYFKHVYKEKCQ